MESELKKTYYKLMRNKCLHDARNDVDPAIALTIPTGALSRSIMIRSGAENKLISELNELYWNGISEIPEQPKYSGRMR
jgi:hypothetical protein